MKFISLCSTARLLALATAIGLVGCGESPQKKLIGKWQMDATPMQEAMRQAFEAQAAKAPAGSPAKEAMDRALASMATSTTNMRIWIEFNSSGSFTRSAIGAGGAAKAETGTWTLASTKENEISLATTVEGESEDVTFVFVDHDTFELKFPEGAPMNTAAGAKPPRFKRVTK